MQSSADPDTPVDEPERSEPGVDRNARLGRRLRVVVAAIWLGLILAFLFGGVARGLTVERTVELVRAAGVWGIAGYLLAFALLLPLGFSGHVLTIASALIWDWWLALPLALVGAVLSAINCYLIARYLAFDWVQSRLPERIRKYESWLVERGLLGVIGFRVLTFTLHPAQLMIGTLRIRFSTMVLGTAIGFVPQICLDVLVGGEVLRWVLAALGWS